MADTQTVLPAATPARVQDPYRSFLTCRSQDDLGARVLDQVGAWMRQQKRWDPELSREGFQQDAGREVLMVRREGAEGSDLRFRLIEPGTKTGTWRTELTLHAPDRGDGWLLLEVSNSEQRVVSRPRLAKYLLEALELRDGPGPPLSGAPIIVRDDEVERLAGWLSDGDRNGLMFVGGTDNRLPFDPFVGQVDRWTDQTLGLARTFVLTPGATPLLAEILGTDFGVRPWTLRTFLPGVDPARDGDARRHRFLSTRRLGQDTDTYTRRFLGGIARRHAAQRILLPGVTRVRRALTRCENLLVLDDLAPEPIITEPVRAEPVAAVPDVPGSVLPEVLAPEAPMQKPTTTRNSAASEPTIGSDTAPEVGELGRLRTQLTLVQDVLGLMSVDEPALRALLRRARSGPDPEARQRIEVRFTEQEDTIARLTLERDEAREELDDEKIEHAETSEYREELADENRWLRTRLREQRDFDGAAGPTPDEEVTRYPDTYDQLLDWLEGLRQVDVEFTGEARDCLDLREYDTLGKVLNTTWDVLTVLRDYVAARANGDCTGGVVAYLSRPPTGPYRTVSVRKHAITETATTMERFRSERMFRVPAAVDPAGRTEMTAHFKLGRIGMISPRLYYFDDVPGTGKVYVGYIGKHLTNTQTR